jgi:hypothetical protein
MFLECDVLPRDQSGFNGLKVPAQVQCLDYVVLAFFKTFYKRFSIVLHRHKGQFTYKGQLKGLGREIESTDSGSGYSRQHLGVFYIY